MLYLDYAKPMGNGYILNFFADSEEDLEEISGGKEFITNNGTNYGVPQPSSTTVVVSPNMTKKTFILNDVGDWIENPNISTFFKPILNARAGNTGNSPIQCLADRIGEFGVADNEYSDETGFSCSVENVEIRDFSYWGGLNPDGGGYSQNCPKEGELYLIVLPDCDPRGSILELKTTEQNEWTLEQYCVPYISDAYICKVLANRKENEEYVYLVNYDCTNSYDEIENVYYSVFNNKKPNFDFSTINFVLGIHSEELFVASQGFIVRNKNCHTQIYQAIRIK